MPTKVNLNALPPHMMELWLRAAKEEIRVPFPTKGAASHFRSKMYSMRKELRNISHPISPIADRVAIRNPIPSEDGERWILIFCPAEKDVIDILESIGITGDNLGEGEGEGWGPGG